MKVFQQNELMAAYAFAKEGGQALHLMAGSFAYLRKDTPACFKGRGYIAHLFDQDRKRLEATARKLGVRKILVERAGDPMRQHIDLCGKPLERAMAMTVKEAEPVVFQNEFLVSFLGDAPESELKAGGKVNIEIKELDRLREAAAYASFARPILEKLGDKNPLADI